MCCSPIVYIFIFQCLEFQSVLLFQRHHLVCVPTLDLDLLFFIFSFSRSVVKLTAFLRDYNSWRFNLVISYSEQMIQRFAFILFRVLRWYKAFFRRYSFHMLLADRLPKTLTLFIVITANTRYWANDGFMLAHPLRRWPSFVSIYRVCWDVSQG